MLLTHHDLGGTGPVVLLLHANSLHGRVFQPMVDDALRAHFHCIAFDLPGQGASPAWPQGPSAMTIPDVVEAVYETLCAMGLHGCLCFGQSLGAAVGLLVEAAHPATFAALYVYEPPIMTAASLPRILAWERAQQLTPPGQLLRDMARKRRGVFDSATAAAAQLGSKPPFSKWERRVLAQYLAHGLRSLREDGSGPVALACSPDTEAAVYSMMEPPPTFHAPDIRCPVVWAIGGAAAGVHSRLPRLGRELWGELPSGALQVFEPLSHFGPQEQPHMVGSAVAALFRHVVSGGACHTPGAGAQAAGSVPDTASSRTTAAFGADGGLPAGMTSWVLLQNEDIGIKQPPSKL